VRHALTLAGVLLLALALLTPYRGYLTDDTFIHLQFAKHLVQGQGFAFNAGEPTYGATSPLWVGLLAAAGALAPGLVSAPRDPAAMPWLASVAKLYGVAFTLLAVLLLVRLARRIGWDPGTSLALGALLALHAWSARWAVSGMETPLAVACVVGALLLLARSLLEGRGAFPAGLVLGIGALVRPELHLFALLAIGVLAWACHGGSSRRVLAAAVGWALVVIPWEAVAFAMFHRLLPNTAAAKAGAWLDAAQALSALRSSIHIILAADALPVTLFVLVVAVGSPATALPPARGRRAFWLLAAIWPAALVLALTAAGTQVVSRYLLPAVPCLLLLGVASLRWLIARNAPRRGAPALAALLALYAGQNLYVTLRVAAPSAVEHTRGLRASLVAIGIWARDATPRDAAFAVADIGAFGYYSERRVLDLFGLVTPAMAPLVVREGYDAVVRDLRFEVAGRPRYLIDRAVEQNRLARPGGEPGPYRFLFARSIANLGITRPVPYAYSVYEIDWRAYDAIRVRTADGRSKDRLEALRRVTYNEGKGLLAPIDRGGSHQDSKNL
jgi:hypothetical protein